MKRTQVIAPPPSASRHTLVFWVLVGYLLFVVYGSLVPLHFVHRPFDEAINAFLNIPFLHLGMDSRADWVANLLLFIPLSFLGNQFATVGHTGFRKHFISIIILAATICLAVSIEFTQLYFPQRTVSQNDIWAESLGSLIGIACQYQWGARFDVWLDRFWHNEGSKNRLMRALNVYLVILLMFSILPLDLTLSPIELYHKWTEGRIVLIPFAGLKGTFFDKAYETLTDLLIWMPAGLLWGLDRKHSIVRIAAMGLLAATAIELAQLFVYSRVTDITDVLLAGIGTGIGALFAHRRNMSISPISKPNNFFWLTLWLFWVILILAVFWFPFDFDASRASLAKVQSVFFRPIFQSYYYGSEYHATNEFLRKLAFFLPGGVLWVFATGLGTTTSKRAGITGVILLFIVALLVESGQLFLPHKYADLTDVLIQTIGGLSGILITRWILSGRSDGSSNDSTQPAPTIPVKSPDAGTFDSRKPSALRQQPQFVTFVALAATIGIATRLPFVPYNVRELISPGIFGLISIIGLSLAILWLINGHSIFLERCKRQHNLMLMLPLWLLFHGVVTWTLLRIAVPMESIHDIVGAPTLGWFWEWELIGRYLALHAAINLQIIGAVLLVSTIRESRQLANFLTWCIWSSLLAWPLHWLVVSQAATDNLTELMDNGGTFFSSTLLAFGVFSFFLAGTAISSLLSSRKHLNSIIALSGISILLAGICFWFGTEQVIVKYGKVFSAWQFLLSPNRASYAVGASLYLRFIAAGVVLLGFWALIQAPTWRKISRQQAKLQKST